MKVQLYYFADCPSFERAAENLREALRKEDLPDSIEMVEVACKDDALRKRFIGSPSIRIDGVDLEGLDAESKGYGYGCRIYRDNGSLVGWPSVESILEVLRERRVASAQSLCPLFTMELQYRPDASPVACERTPEGKRLGGGDGEVRGVAASGDVRWDIYEDQGEDMCKFNLVGLIETDERSISFDARGFGARRSDKLTHWTMLSAAKFEATGEGVTGWTSSPAILVGGFDSETGLHCYQVLGPGQLDCRAPSVRVSTEAPSPCCG